MKKRGYYISICMALLTPIVLFSQTPNWIYEYNGPNSGDDRAYDLVYGSDSNIYVAGYSEGTDDDITVISLTTAGDTNWIYRFNGTGNQFDHAYDIVYGADGNIYVTGVTIGSGTAVRDLIVISLSSSTGDTNWTYIYNSGPSTYDEGHAIAYGTDGNIYVAGWTDNDYFTILSLTNAGTERWLYPYDYSGSYDIANSIVYGADGNIYAAGYSFGNASDMLVVSTDATGNYRWDYAYNGSSNNADSAYAIAYADDNHLYVAGTSNNTTTGVDFTVAKLDTAGTEEWVYKYNNPSANGSDRAFSLVYGNDGNIYAAGESYSSTTNNDFTVVSLDPTGTERWVCKDSTYYFTSWNWADRFNSIAYGGDGNIYAAGVSGSMGGDFTVMSFTSSGTKRWEYKPNFGSDDAANSVIYGSDNVYACGYRFINAYPITDYDLVVISLESGAGVEESKKTYGSELHASPTIFKDLITLTFSTPLNENLVVKFYDVCGIIRFDKSYICNSRTLTLNDEAIKRLGDGVYFLSVRTRDIDLGEIKIIKQ